MEALGKHDFNSRDQDELSFRKGQMLKVLNTEGGEWFKAECEGSEGMVPSNYLEMKTPNWYHGKITRAGSESYLMPLHDGAFLVRESESSPGDFTLSVKYSTSVQHFKILRDASVGKYFLWVVKFNSINKLVEEHRSTSVSRTENIFLKDEEETVNKEQVRGLYKFVPTSTEELAFNVGDIITLLDKSDPNWWQGELNGRQGQIPSNYVEPV